MLYDDNKIEEIEYSIYLRWFNEFIQDQPKTNFIYIKTTPDICLKRINHRDRIGEENIPLSYLVNCDKYHEDWFKNVNDILILNGNENENHLNNIIDFIKLQTII